MAGGWTRDGAVQDQIDDPIKHAVGAACVRLQSGEIWQSRSQPRRAHASQVGPADVVVAGDGLGIVVIKLAPDF